jgi:hypothetical protein
MTSAVREQDLGQSLYSSAFFQLVGLRLLERYLVGNNRGPLMS